MLKFDLSDYVEEEQVLNTNAMYLISKANIFCVGKNIVMKNNTNTINQFDEQDNAKMLNFMNSLGLDISEIAPTKMFVEELTTLVKNLSVNIAISADDFMFYLN